jgi:hypothetical protein
MYKPGDHYVICDICGFRRLRSQCRKNWMGQIVCGDTCYESRHPLDNPRTKTERQRKLDVRPEKEDVYLEYGDAKAEDL